MALELTYKDVRIAYDQFDDKWHFTLRGMQRRADSVKAAKGIIDQPPSKADGLFKRTPVWIDTFHFRRDGFVKAEATSVMMEYGTIHAWVVCNKEREKKHARECYPVSLENDKLVKQIQELDKELKDRQTRRSKLVDRLTTLEAVVEKIDETAKEKSLRL